MNSEYRAYLDDMGIVHHPRYAHDCPSDVFLGIYKTFDLWTCPQGNIPTVIARASDEPSDYHSGMAFAIGRLLYPHGDDPIGDALLVALRRGIGRHVLLLNVKWTGPVLDREDA